MSTSNYRHTKKPNLWLNDDKELDPGEGVVRLRCKIGADARESRWSRLDPEVTRASGITGEMGLSELNTKKDMQYQPMKFNNRESLNYQEVC